MFVGERPQHVAILAERLGPRNQRVLFNYIQYRLCREILRCFMLPKINQDSVIKARRRLLIGANRLTFSMLLTAVRYSRPSQIIGVFSEMVSVHVQTP